MNSETQTGPRRGRLYAWLQLVRLPNLLTVPGDPLAGFFLATSSLYPGGAVSVVVPVVAGLLLYVFGLISNDLFDLKDDLVERPDRPLPSGRIRVPVATVAACVVALGAIGIASLNGPVSLAVAGTLAVAITVYNSVGKRIPVLGPLNMGVCRGLNLMLGASAAGLPGLTAGPVLMCAALVTAYIAAVTWIAAGEMTSRAVGFKRWLPALVIVLMVLPLAAGTAQVARPLNMKLFSGCLAVAAFLWSRRAGALLAGLPGRETVPPVIGRLIQGLLILQALFLSLCVWPAIVPAIVILLTIPVFSLLARRFYAS